MFAAAFAMFAGAAVRQPAAVCAADSETVTALPDWVPADYETALSYRDHNILIHDDLLCIVSTEYELDSEGKGYSFSYSEEQFTAVSSAVYGDNGQIWMRVDVLKAAAPGMAQVFHTDDRVAQSSKMYAFSVDESLQISQIELPKWFPKYFDSALTMYNSYGKTRVSSGLLCTVFHETYHEDPDSRIEDMYALTYTEAQLRCLCSVRYHSGSDRLLVSLFEPAAPGEAVVTHENTLYSDAPYEYTFAIDESLNIKETDLCAWAPDCAGEFQSRLEANGAVMTHGGDILFLLETTGGTGYSWQEAAGDPAYAEFVGSIDCTRLKIYADGQRPSGGACLEAYIYRAKQDGQFELRLDLMPPGRDSEAADSLGGVMRVTDQAGMVLLPGEARVTLIDADTGKPLVYPFDRNRSLYLYYLIGTESLDPDDFHPSIYEQLPAAVSKLPIGSLFANEQYSLWMSSSGEFDGYRCDAVYENGACDSGDAITVTRYTDDIADITVRMQFRAVGDINDDGAFSIADAVVLQRWLLCTLDAVPERWKAGDFANDDRLDARDLTLMKRSLLEREAAIEENGLLLRVHTTYGGYGVMGQDLGHGSYDTEFLVIEGDAFYETYGGNWYQNVRKSSSLLLRIEKIEADTVTVSVLTNHNGSRKEAVLNIGEPADDLVFTDNVMYDGINYSYEICFEHIPSADSPQ